MAPQRSHLLHHAGVGGGGGGLHQHAGEADPLAAAAVVVLQVGTERVLPALQSALQTVISLGRDVLSWASELFSSK